MSLPKTSDNLSSVIYIKSLFITGYNNIVRSIKNYVKYKNFQFLRTLKKSGVCLRCFYHLPHVFLLTLIFSPVALASEINMVAISMIESSGGKHLVGDGGRSHGQYQVSDITILEYEQMTGRKGSDYDAVAHWYIEKRIPQMLRHFDIPVTTKNVIRAYNSGIKNVIEGRVPKITDQYLKKYEDFTGEVLT